MFSIEQRGNQWAVLSNGEQVGDLHGSYDDALGEISKLLGAQLASAPEEAAAPDSPDGLLPERWTTTTGVAFSEPTGDGRDFTGCTWSFRDPAVYPLPLMHQTETEMGHFGAVVAGYADTVSDGGGTPTMGGRFYDSEAGVAMRNMMLDGRRMGVSVDPGQVEAEFVCTDYDDDGWCNDGDYHFLAYEVIGLTGTPFPAFANATIELEGNAAAAPAADAAAPVAASAGSWTEIAVRPLVAAAGLTLAAPLRPPAAWFAMPEPELGDPLLIEQQDGSLAVPLHITDDGQVFGHMARWGQCHVANPHGPDVCTTPPETANYDQSYHLGHVICEGGEDVATGPLIAGCDHASTRLSVSAAEARDHYAHSGVAWADVRTTNGQFGPWVCGALRPEVTELQLRVLRASSLSGDWREIPEAPGVVSLIAGLATNVPGFPIARQALVASGMEIAGAQMRAAVRDGQVVALVASGIVQPCPDCARRAALATRAGAGSDRLERKLDEVLRSLDVLDRRTAHLRRDEARALAARMGRPLT